MVGEKVRKIMEDLTADKKAENLNRSLLEDIKQIILKQKDKTSGGE